MDTHSASIFDTGPRTLPGEGDALPQMVLGKPDGHSQRNEMKPLSTPLTEMNSTWIRDVNVRPGTIKILEGNKGKDLLDTGWQ